MTVRIVSVSVEIAKEGRTNAPPYCIAFSVFVVVFCCNNYCSKSMILRYFQINFLPFWM